MKSNSSVLNVYKKKTKKSEVVTQLLYGDTFKKLLNEGTWIKIKNDSDNYVGFIKNRKFSKDHKNTHKISVLHSNLYSKASSRNKIKKKLSFGSKIKVIDNKARFFRFSKGWISKNDVKPISYKEKDPFRRISIFKNIKYKWGGKSFKGIDCSALIQLFLNFNNKFCPRDAKDQVKYFKKNIKLKNIKKNDIIYWKGHVALALSKKKLIHAYGPMKKTLIMNIDQTIKRIDRTAKLKIIGIKRV